MFEKMIREKTAQQSQQLEQWFSKHSAEHPLPDDVEVVRDIDYMGDGAKCHMMDVYRPKGAGGVLPVLFNIHGGGFLLGRKEVNSLFCADMAQRGFVVICPEYPLVPDETVFEILRSLTAAVNFAAAHFAEYGADAGRVYLSGDSAGAWLCTYLAAIKNCAEIAEAAGAEPVSVGIEALGLISGMFYTRKLDEVGIFLPKLIYGADWRKSAFRPFMDPENEKLLRSLPRAMLITADGDFLRHYSRSFAAALTRAGAKCELYDVTADRKLPHAFSALLPEYPESQEANALLASFLLGTEK